jgi:hypothetical protein
MTNWSDSEFERLRALADPLIDEQVAAYARDQPEITDIADLTKVLVKELSEAKQMARRNPTSSVRESAPHLFRLSEKLPELPDWARDAKLIEQGQAVYVSNGLYQSAALFFASLPLSYADERSADILVQGEFANRAPGRFTRRVAETGQMLIDVMGLRGSKSLEPFGPGYVTAVGLRLLHSCVRALTLRKERQPPWDKKRFGTPVNQELLLATLLDFSFVTWAALERMGVKLSKADRAANLYTWSVVGFLMGVDPCQQHPLTLDDIPQISEQLSRHLGHTDAGCQLMQDLLDEMESLMPLGWRKLPRSLIHWMFEDQPYGVHRVPNLLEVPAPAWWSRPLLGGLQAVNNRVWSDQLAWSPFQMPVRSLLRNAGRILLVAYADEYAANRRPPFEIPDDLVRQWQIRTTPRAHAAREKRRTMRRRTRQVGRASSEFLARRTVRRGSQ